MRCKIEQHVANYRSIFCLRSRSDAYTFRWELCCVSGQKKVSHISKNESKALEEQDHSATQRQLSFIYFLRWFWREIKSNTVCWGIMLPSGPVPDGASSPTCANASVLRMPFGTDSSWRNRRACCYSPVSGLNRKNQCKHFCNWQFAWNASNSLMDFHHSACAFPLASL